MAIGDIIHYVVSILSGLCICIPLVYKLVTTIQAYIKEKNWNKLLALVMRLMAEAEEKFDNGADRKSWVLGMVAASAEIVDYNIDLEELSNLIDQLCAMSKKVNPPKEVTE